MRKKSGQCQKYYFSERLKKQLAQISHSPLTVVEAPSGFGKTTAVREYLNENRTHGAQEYWYTCLGESPAMAWVGICELFSNINCKVADDLKNLKIPTMETLFYMSTYLRDLRCKTDTYLVIDNYQLINSDIPRELISVFSMHGDPKLHMIFITQQLPSKQHGAIHNSNIYTIDASSFFFDRKGTADLFRMEGIRLTDDELEKVFMSTEGWVSAIRLQMINFLETGSFNLAADIEQLVEHAIWSGLTTQEKDFLLSVSVLESFTARQAAIMLGQDTMPEAVEELIKNNDFIRYLPDKHLYSIHSIFQDYLRNRLYNHMPEDYQNKVFLKAGASCAAMEHYCPAAEFFYKVKDFESIMSMPFTREYLEEQKEKYHSGFCSTIIRECPDEILRRHPLNMIIFGYTTYLSGYYDEYHKLCRLLHDVIQDGTGYSEEELRKINGEYTLLKSVGAFNDIAAMQENQRKAWEILGESTDMIKADSPWLFGAVSMLSTFWRESGKLEETMQQLEKGKDIFTRLTRGHGAGSSYLMRAEALLMRGEDDEAEIMCHKAMYSARSFVQTDICIGIELVLARIAILRGNVEDYFRAVDNIQSYSRENSSIYIMRIVEHALSIISILLNVKDHVAPWFYDMERIKRVENGPVAPLAEIIHLKLLLMDKRYNEFYGICRLGIEESEKQTDNTRYMMLKVYQLILLAIAERNNGKPLEAQEYIKQALAIALPDGVYLPFAQEELMEEFIAQIPLFQSPLSHLGGGGGGGGNPF